MSGRATKNRGISLLLVIAMLVTTILLPAPSAGAATNIKIDAFIKLLVQAINLEVDSTTGDPYIDAAQKVGILYTGDFTNYTDKITRTDAAVLINRADEYLHGDTMDAELLEVILEKRISDINKIAVSKREAVAKIYAKGIIKGYGNGYYIQNRSFKGSKYISVSGAKNMINLVVKPSGRAKISPDGQLIRTTNLPKNASSYEYILASFPNKFYEKQFEFMISDRYKKESYKDFFAYPVDMKSWTFKNWYTEWPFSIERDKYLYDWVEMADTYLNYVFNVNYRTVNDDWIEGLGSLYAKSNCNEADDIRTYYLDKMKSNKVIIESSIITVEPSTLYYNNGYHMRAYVHYRISAKNINVPHNKLLYSQYPYFKNLISGEWREGIFDIEFGTNNGSSGDGSCWAIATMTSFDDSFNVPIK
jgi:hypothetical protein